MLAVRKKAVKESPSFTRKEISQFCSVFHIHFSVTLMCLMSSAHPGQEQSQQVTGAHQTPAGRAGWQRHSRGVGLSVLNFIEAE